MEYLEILFSGMGVLIATVAVSYAILEHGALTRSKPKPSYSERLTELIGRLASASAEVDSILKDLAAAAGDKEKVVRRLEQDIDNLNRREGELQERIKTLSDVPLPAADYFAELIGGNEKRKAKRDYYLFGAGVVVTTIVGILVQLVTG